MSRLEEIKARCEKATLGPWSNAHTITGSDPEDTRECDLLVYKQHGLGDPQFLVATTEKGPQNFENMEFIAHSREDIPYLLGIIEKLASFNKANYKEE